VLLSAVAAPLFRTIGLAASLVTVI